MSAFVLLNLLNEFRKQKIRCEALPASYLFLINSIIHEQKCKILFII